jgi:uncharacterized membrane protein
MEFWKTFGAVLVALLVLDAVWLTVRKDYHMSFFYAVQKSPLTVRWAPAAVVYILLATGIAWALKDARTLKRATLTGAAVGAVMYGFYDATNYATLERWTAEMAITDTLWGTVAGAGAAATAFQILK